MVVSLKLVVDSRNRVPLVNRADDDLLAVVDVLRDLDLEVIAQLGLEVGLDVLLADSNVVDPDHDVPSVVLNHDEALPLV